VAGVVVQAVSRNAVFRVGDVLRYFAVFEVESVDSGFGGVHEGHVLEGVSEVAVVDVYACVCVCVCVCVCMYVVVG
jgi:hypothetical protein